MFQNQFNHYGQRQNTQPSVELHEFTHENVNEAFGLSQEFKSSELIDQWLKRSRTIEISIEEKDRLTQLQDKLLIYGKAWNVQELKERFIAPITEAVHFYDFEMKYGAFSKRTIEATIHNTKVSGQVDWIIASGQYQPKQPFLFLNSHTYENSYGVDPVGKILATLYVAKVFNQTPVKPSLFNPNPKMYKNIPLYGIYVIGSLWYFARLKGNRYYISPAYDATYTEELHNIFRMLKAQKAMIEEKIIQKPATSEMTI